LDNKELYLKVPYLIDNNNNNKITESMAILKYLCKIGNRIEMLGKNVDD